MSRDKRAMAAVELRRTPEDQLSDVGLYGFSLAS